MCWLQMLMESSEEGNCEGLSWIKGKVVKLSKDKLPAENKIPNMGWIDTKIKKDSKLFDDTVHVNVVGSKIFCNKLIDTLNYKSNNIVSKSK